MVQDAISEYEAQIAALVAAVPALSTTADFIRFAAITLLQTRSAVDRLCAQPVPLARVLGPQLRLTSRLSAWRSEYTHRPEEAASDTFPEDLRARTKHLVELNTTFATNLARLTKAQRNQIVTALEHLLPLMITLEILRCADTDEEVREVLQHLVTPSLARHPEFLFALPERATLVLATVPPPEVLGAEKLYPDQLQGRVGIWIHLQAAILRVFDDVSRTLVLAVLDGDVDALLDGIRALDQLLRFFQGPPLSLPTADVVALDGQLTMRTLLDAVDKGSVNVVADREPAAVLDARTDERRFFIIFPGDVAPFTSTITFGAQDAYRARPLHFARQHHEEMSSSLLVQYAQRDRSALLNLRQMMLLDEQWQLFAAAAMEARRRATETVPVAALVTLVRYVLRHRLRRLGLDDDLIDALLDGLLEILKRTFGS